MFTKQKQTNKQKPPRFLQFQQGTDNYLLLNSSTNRKNNALYVHY